jgi:hypothetical protein
MYSPPGGVVANVVLLQQQRSGASATLVAADASPSTRSADASAGVPSIVVHRSEPDSHGR